MCAFDATLSTCQQQMIIAAKKEGAPLTVETCHHYLSLESETVPDGATEYKCCPPIREKSNQVGFLKTL